jgi:hypothetical protein
VVSAVVILAVIFLSIRDDGVSGSIGDTLREELLDLVAVLPYTEIDDGRRRYLREDAVTVVCGITIAE